MHQCLLSWCSGILAEVPLRGWRRHFKMRTLFHPFRSLVIVKETPYCASAALRAHRLWSRDQRRTGTARKPAPGVTLPPRPPPPTAPARSLSPSPSSQEHSSRTERLTLLAHAHLRPQESRRNTSCVRRWRVAPTAASLPARPSWRGRRRGAAGSCRPLLCGSQ